MCVPCCALLIELAYDVLERGPIGRDAVPAHANDVHEPVADEIGRRNRGPHVLICSNIQEVCSHHYRENAELCGRGYSLITEFRTALSSINGHGSSPMVRISPQEMANA